MSSKILGFKRNRNDIQLENNNIIKTNSNKNKNQNNLLLLEDKITEERNNNKANIQLEIDNDDKYQQKHKNKNFTPFKNDPYLDSNIISRFFMYWAFKIISISTKTNMKKEYLGKIGDAHDSKHFNNQISYIWEEK